MTDQRPEHRFAIRLAGSARGGPVSVLYQGPPKSSGKTHHALTWPKPLYIPFDRNTETAEKFEDVVIVHPRSIEEFEDSIIDWLLDGAHKDYPDRETIVIDTWSALAEEMEVSMQDLHPQAKKGKAVDVDWMLFSARQAGLLSKLTRLPKSPALPKNYNLIVTVHEKDKYTSIKTPQGWERELVGIQPAISGRTADRLGAYFDLILLPQVEYEVVTQQGQPGRRIPRWRCRAIAADRYRAAGGTIWGHTLPEFVDGTYAGLRKECGLDEGGGA